MCAPIGEIKSKRKKENNNSMCHIVTKEISFEAFMGGRKRGNMCKSKIKERLLLLG